MNYKKEVKRLCDLAQLDIDAVNAYETALKKIDDKLIYQTVDQFRQDHIRHIDELNNLVVKMGGEPVELTKDLKGYLIDGITALRSVTGTKGALKAMETNEVITNKNYLDAVTELANLPEEALTLIRKNYADEQRHLTFIREALKKLELT